MGMTKIISISDEAYRELVKRKGKDDSFTKVVLRLTRETPKRMPSSFAGLWKDRPEIDDILKKILEDRHKRDIRNVVKW